MAGRGRRQAEPEGGRDSGGRRDRELDGERRRTSPARAVGQDESAASCRVVGGEQKAGGGEEMAGGGSSRAWGNFLAAVFLRALSLEFTARWRAHA